jgi:hypothetical protein
MRRPVLTFPLHLSLPVTKKIQAPSASSKGTRASTASSRSSRSSKSNKTRSSGRVPKEGDPWEEDYLIKNRPALIPTKRLRQDLRRLLEALVIFGQHDKAAYLQVCVWSGVLRCAACLAVRWCC